MSVIAGSRVELVNGLDISSPWTLVKATKAPHGKGYVPTTFLEPLSPAAKTSSPRADVSSSSPVVVDRSFGDRTNGMPSPVKSYAPALLSQSTHSASFLDNQRIVRATNAPVEVPGVPHDLHEEFGHIFSKHDRRFNDLVSARSEADRTVAKAAEELENRMHVVRQKTGEVVEAMNAVSSVVGEERSQWKAKLTADKSELYSTTGLLDQNV